MSALSSNVAAWFTRLEPAPAPENIFRRPDDPRLGEVIESWRGDPAALQPGRAVLVGFPQDEGVRRNHGRVGAAAAPQRIRHWLRLLTLWDGEHDIDLTARPPLDAGNVRVARGLEESQNALAEVVAGVVAAGAVPVVLGGGHETSLGHYLGYASAGQAVGIVNLDAHLDVRPPLDGRGHSGSPFRQAMEHPTHPLPGMRYVCLGAQPHAVSREHWLFLRERGGQISWADEVRGRLAEQFRRECDRLAGAGNPVYVTVDADVVCAADVPGVSAPNVTGLPGREVLACARAAGELPPVLGLDVVEINPNHDQDGLSCRWAALLVWNFLVGLTVRCQSS